MSGAPDDSHRAREAGRERLRHARLYLVFTPALCGGRDPLEVLGAALPFVDAVQVRAKEGGAPSAAADAHAWTERVLALRAAHDAQHVPVLVNDRVDVAAALLERGCDGVHLGADDTPADVARAVLGPGALIGLSTHGPRDVARAPEEALDYLGFGPVFPTATKGYARGLGPESAWVAANATSLPLFPIGGVDAHRAAELAPVGRAAVASAILAADDPAGAARALREALASG